MYIADTLSQAYDVNNKTDIDLDNSEIEVYVNMMKKKLDISDKKIEDLKMQQLLIMK